MFLGADLWGVQQSFASTTSPRDTELGGHRSPPSFTEGLNVITLRIEGKSQAQRKDKKILSQLGPRPDDEENMVDFEHNGNTGVTKSNPRESRERLLYRRNAEHKSCISRDLHFPQVL